MATIATGVFQRTTSIGAFDSVAIEWIVIAGMIVGNLPFAHYLAMVPVAGNHFCRTHRSLVYFLQLSASCWHLNTSGMPWYGHQAISFNAVSIMTGTGCGGTVFSFRAGLPHAASIAMFIGGCGGSTTCGIKVFRLGIGDDSKGADQPPASPHAVVLAYYNKRPVAPEVMDSVMSFFYLYILCFVLLSILLGMMGLDFVTALSGAATSISNGGRGGNLIGNGNFAPYLMRQNGGLRNAAWTPRTVHRSGDVDGHVLGR